MVTLETGAAVDEQVQASGKNHVDWFAVAAALTPIMTLIGAIMAFCSYAQLRTRKSAVLGARAPGVYRLMSKRIFNTQEWIGDMTQKRTLPLIIILIAILPINIWNSEPNASQANAGPLPQDSPTISFDRTAVSVIEPDSGETLALTLNAVISNAPEQGAEARVTYMTVNGSAEANVDYVPATGELVFPVGSLDSQSFEVTILGNNIDQPNRTFIVFLTNPVNATVTAPVLIIITIVDNDTPSTVFLPLIRGLVAGQTPTPKPYPISSKVG